MADTVAPGTLTFLFTDLVDSTLLWEQREAEMAEAVARHDQLLGDAVERYAGKVVKFQGDGLMAVFTEADSAARAAVEGQRDLAEASLPFRLGVRMGLCTGVARSQDGDYHGQVVNRAARAAGAAHPGQILVAPSTAALLGAFQLRDLGEHRLKGLAPMRLSQVLADAIESDFPPLLVPPIALGVAPATAFVGRAHELGAVQQLIADHAVVTLTGAGGSGKTRLAIEAAETVSGQYPDGIRFADLAVITDADGVGDAVARALGLIDNGVLEDQIMRIAVHLESRAILCILDNCEHLLDSCAELVEAAMERRGASRLLATSREPLGVPGEQVYLVPSLDARTDATTLFTARASEVRPELIIDDATAEVVAKICERLDGIPLAIELAAARVNQLTPTQLLERLGDRFRLLTGGRRRVQRQQTLAATLDWSHDLLDEEERTLLRRLAAFPSSFSIDAAEAVTGTSGVITLGSLVTKSLVNVVDGDEHFRYRLLETVRLYAEEKLAAAGESHDVRQRHAEWVLASLEATPLESRWFGDEPRPVDIADVNAALEWATVEGPASLTARLASGVSWTRFDHWRDGIRWCQAALHAQELEPGERLQVQMMLAQVNTFGMTNDHQELAEQDRAVAAVLVTGVDDPLVAFNWVWRGSTGATLAEMQQDANLAERCAEWMERGTSSTPGASLPWRACMALLAGFGYTTLQRNADAQRHLVAAIQYASQVDGFEEIQSAARAFLSLHRVVDGDVGTARALTEGLVEPPEPSMFSREGLVVAAVAVAAAGDGVAARRRLRDAYDRARRVDQRFGIEHVIVFAGAVAAVERDWDTAVRVLAASREGFRRTPFAYLAFLTFRERARVALGVARFRELREEGRRLTFDEAIALVSVTS